jgi:hypothetical protein
MLNGSKCPNTARLARLSVFVSNGLPGIGLWARMMANFSDSAFWVARYLALARAPEF